MVVRALATLSLLSCLSALYAGEPEPASRAAAPAPVPPGMQNPSLYLPNLVTAEQALERGQADGLNAPAGRGAALQMLSFQLAFVGETERAIDVFDQQTRAVPPLTPEQFSRMQQLADVRAEDAIHAIVEQARDKQVVLINEAHHVPMHRAFSRKLAAELRKIGYTWLAAETFGSYGRGGVVLTATGRTRATTGLYTRDPVFAEFVNAAVADGWKLVPYEFEARTAPGTTPAERAKQREQAQARNLVERIFAKDPNAKVLIHVGYGHLNKEFSGNAGASLMMGAHLQRMTGLKMLHVDQTDLYAHPDPAHEGPLYAGLVEKFPLKEPFVLRAPDGGFPVLQGKQGLVDMQVIFPRYATRDGRPEWLQTLAGRTPRAIPPELLPKQGRRLIKALRATDGPDAVPADIVLVEAGKPAPKLMLPPGEFRYTTEEPVL